MQDDKLRRMLPELVRVILDLDSCLPRVLILEKKIALVEQMKQAHLGQSRGGQVPKVEKCLADLRQRLEELYKERLGLRYSLFLFKFELDGQDVDKLSDDKLEQFSQELDIELIKLSCALN